MPLYQRTIKSDISITGIGLHTGVTCTATFKPAEVNRGICFVRTDLADCPLIPADIDHVVDVDRGTSIELNGARIHTVEHVLAAVSGLDIDNIIVELTEKEPPVMDGSAKPFVDVLLEAGLMEQNANKKVLVIDKAVSFSDPDNDIEMQVLPSDHFRITFNMDYRHLTIMGAQFMSVYSMEEDFKERIAPARTFALFSEVARLKEAGLAKGGSLDNAVVFVDRPIDPAEIPHLKKMFNIKGDLAVGENNILKGQKLRFENEAVRHKILDLIGDLALLGMPIRGHVVSSRSGHGSNVALVRRIKEVYSKRIELKRSSSLSDKAKFDVRAINNILPHRYPFLLIDRVLDVVPGKQVKALKNLTANEHFFQGHFAGQPVMPGVLLLEAMAQAGGFLLLNTVSDPSTKLVYITTIESARFRKAAVPGDQVYLEIDMLRMRLSAFKFRGRAYVDDELIAEAVIMAHMVDREE